MFVVWHASQMPKVHADAPRITAIDGGLRAIDVTFVNLGAIPTRTGQAALRRIGAPDRVTFEGDAGLAVISAGVVDPATGAVADPVLRRPADLRLWQGIAGDSAVRVRFVVRGTGKARITWRAEKGGTATVEAEAR
jgi:hypothetical protein